MLLISDRVVARATTLSRSWEEEGAAQSNTHMYMLIVKVIYDHWGLLAMYDHQGLLAMYDHWGLLVMYDHRGLLVMYDYRGLLAMHNYRGLLAMYDYQDSELRYKCFDPRIFISYCISPKHLDFYLSTLHVCKSSITPDGHPQPHHTLESQQIIPW